jgi:predicted RNA-binding Zn-ribbon protein involved in translation (DUF1610 family)
MTEKKSREQWKELATAKVHARCECCGHGWKLYRGDAFACPHCGNSPEYVICRARSFVQLPEEPMEWSAWKRY